MIELLTALALAASSAAVQPDERPVLRITIYGNDRCPPSTRTHSCVSARKR